jgi:hypothetical protein
MIDTFNGINVEVCDYMRGVSRVVKAFGLLHVSREWLDRAKKATPEEMAELCQAEVLDMDEGGRLDPFMLSQKFSSAK